MAHASPPPLQQRLLSPPRATLHCSPRPRFQVPPRIKRHGGMGARSLLRGEARVQSNRDIGHGAIGATGVGPALIRRPRLGVRAQSSSSEGGDKTVYSGVYGLWTVDDSDRIEVLSYRAGLLTVSFCILACSLPALLPPASPLSAALLPYQDALFWTGTGALGCSLLLIHIYVTPIKRTLQALWAAGALGALLLSSHFLPHHPSSSSSSLSLLHFVVLHPASVWAVGPLFAALTGLVFKEGLCYGKLEAALLALLIPTLLLCHLAGVMGEEVERPLLVLWVLLSLVFALRKFTQPLKDDIGDKSVFMFQALSSEEQARVLAELDTQLRGQPPSQSESQ